MQNITARYNIIYNARNILEASKKRIEAAHADDYERYLSVYKEPEDAASKAETKLLDSVIQKTNSIVADKIKSNYVDDAYYLKAEANYFKGDYYTASEFFDYVYATYPEEKELRQASLVWKARAQLQLNNLPEAARALDTAFKYLQTEKASVADIYATKAQLDINSGKEAEAIRMLEEALKSEKNKALRIRWTYLLAQLQQHNELLQPAYDNYSKVIKSNAPFEMAFNAHLNRIHIEEQQSGRAGDQIDRFKALLRDNKNKDFIDQIYYHIAELYQERGEQAAAISNYNTAIRNSTKNQRQQGLAYLQIADIYFKDGDYKRAKTYYDSTLTVLPPSYPDYELIRLKSSNLDLLADRLQTIAREDTLQMLARLPEADRMQRIDAIMKARTVRQTDTLAFGNTSPNSADTHAIRVAGADSRFYFNNAIALAQGLTDFRLKWGNRKLEDNWRRGKKTATEIANTSPGTGTANLVNPDNTDTAALRNTYMSNLPLTPALLQQSDQRIINAYYDIANYYKDVLKDDDEAVKTYQELLKRYPDNSMNAAVYYNLYRIYSSPDPAKAAEYRDILLKKYPETTFSKVILDPNYSRELGQRESALNQAYDLAYNLYSDKKYAEVIARIRQTEQQFGTSSLSPQLAYLEALALGRTQKLSVFESSLQQIVKNYPDDKLITPLVKQNLEYIAANREAMNRRPFALVDSDPNEPRFVMEPGAEPEKKAPAAIVAPAIKSPENVAVQPETSPGITVPVPEVKAPEVRKPSIFSLPDTAEYYYVVNVLSPVVNLSSSRFGIGQFNRANYSNSKISHQLKEVNRENQLIFVGPFSGRPEIERYQRAINPEIKDIMKIPAGTYNTFIITKDDLEKLTTRAMVNSYLEFYSENNK